MGREGFLTMAQPVCSFLPARTRTANTRPGSDFDSGHVLAKRTVIPQPGDITDRRSRHRPSESLVVSGADKNRQVYDFRMADRPSTWFASIGR
jgi:hypothetical protein